jgi:hypothetical protein
MPLRVRLLPSRVRADRRLGSASRRRGIRLAAGPVIVAGHVPFAVRRMELKMSKTPRYHESDFAVTLWLLAFLIAEIAFWILAFAHMYRT